MKFKRWLEETGIAYLDQDFDPNYIDHMGRNAATKSKAVLEPTKTFQSTIISSIEKRLSDLENKVNRLLKNY